MWARWPTRLNVGTERVDPLGHATHMGYVKRRPGAARRLGLGLVKNAEKPEEIPGKRPRKANRT
jgi:hypothetical protein